MAKKHTHTFTINARFTFFNFLLHYNDYIICSGVMTSIKRTKRRQQKEKIQCDNV